MLSEKELFKIAREECVDMIGKDLVYAHKELCCAAYGILSDGMFHFNLGMDTKCTTNWELGGETPMEFYAFVIIDPNTGEVTRDYESSILPQ